METAAEDPGRQELLLSLLGTAGFKGRWVVGVEGGGWLEARPGEGLVRAGAGLQEADPCAVAELGNVPGRAAVYEQRSRRRDRNF